jgi:hypothetical protein
MKTIRENIFETNSSSTHSLTILSAEEAKKWMNDECYMYDNKCYTLEETLDIMLDAFPEVTKEEGLHEHRLDCFDCYPVLYSEWQDLLSYNLESDIDTYTSKSGDKLTIFSAYGRDS